MGVACAAVACVMFFALIALMWRLRWRRYEEYEQPHTFPRDHGPHTAVRWTKNPAIDESGGRADGGRGSFTAYFNEITFERGGLKRFNSC